MSEQATNEKAGSKRPMNENAESEQPENENFAEEQAESEDCADESAEGEASEDELAEEEEPEDETAEDEESEDDLAEEEEPEDETAEGEESEDELVEEEEPGDDTAEGEESEDELVEEEEPEDEPAEGEESEDDLSEDEESGDKVSEGEQAANAEPVNPATPHAPLKHPRVNPKKKTIIFFPEASNWKGGVARYIVKMLRASKKIKRYNLIWVIKNAKQKKAVWKLDKALIPMTAASKRLKVNLPCASCIINESGRTFSFKKSPGQIILQFANVSYIKARKKQAALDKIDYFVGDSLFLAYMQSQHRIESNRLLHWNYRKLNTRRENDPVIRGALVNAAAITPAMMPRLLKYLSGRNINNYVPYKSSQSFQCSGGKLSRLKDKIFRSAKRYVLINSGQFFKRSKMVLRLKGKIFREIKEYVPFKSIHSYKYSGGKLSRLKDRTFRSARRYVLIKSGLSFKCVSKLSRLKGKIFHGGRRHLLIKSSLSFKWSKKLPQLEGKVKIARQGGPWSDAYYRSASTVLIGPKNTLPYWAYLCKRVVPLSKEPTIRRFMREKLIAPTIDTATLPRCDKRFLLGAFNKETKKTFPLMKLKVFNVASAAKYKLVLLKRKADKIKKNVKTAFTNLLKRGKVELKRGYLLANRCLDQLRSEKLRDEKEIYYYKDLYAGQRCFLVGNGPSLTPEDLDMIADSGEIAFGCNKVFKIFENTRWRPTYLCMIDALIAKYSAEELRDSIDCKVFTNKTTLNLMRVKPKEYVAVNNLGEKKYRVSRSFSTYYIPSGATVMTLMLELAMYMGFKEIYLIGVDCTSSLSTDGHGMKGYANAELIKKDIERIRKREHNYSMTAEDVAKYYFEKSMSSYHVIKAYADKKGVKIYNATRGGMLNVYERRNLEEVLAQPKPADPGRKAQGVQLNR